MSILPAHRLSYLILITIITCSLFSMCSGTDDNPIVGRSDDTTPPAIPTGLSLTNVGNGQISIAWNANTEEDFSGYRLYRNEDIDSLAGYTIIFDSSATSFTDTELDFETIYFYRVSAYDLTGNESELSAPIEGQPFNTTAPATPQNLTVNAENLTTPIFDLTWSANMEADLRGYKIYRGTISDFTANAASILDSTLNTSFSDSTIAIDTVYYYRITAYDRGSKESLATASESDVALSPPVLTAPVNNSTTTSTPTFTWNAVENVIQYRIFVQTSSQGGEIWTQTLDSTQTSIQYGGSVPLQTGTPYFWKVATITKDANRLNSISVTFRINIQ